MKNQRQIFTRTFSILNTLLIPVLILSLIDRLNLSFLSKYSIYLSLFITGSLKIYCLSGISGSIVEIISGEQFVFQFRRLHENAKKLWPGFLVFFAVIFLIDVLLFALFPLFPLFRAWKFLYFGLLGAVAACVLALWVIHKKYIGPLNIPRRSLKFNLSFLMVIVSACLLEILLLGASNFIHDWHFYWRNGLAFIVNYIHVFEFIFCSLFIFDHFPEINDQWGHNREIFLINPIGAGVVRSLVFSLARGYPPFFIVLKALSPKTYQFREFNQVLWQDRYYKDNALVCITCYSSNCYEAYKIAKEFKKRGSKVLMGGPHVTYLPDEALAFCDSVVIGQAEGVWREVIHDFENGDLKPVYKGTPKEDDYAQVYEELLNSPPYIAKDFLESMRGCKFRCHFCTVPAISGGQVHLQPINTFVELIKKIRPHYHHVGFIDNNIYSDPGYAKELFTALKPLKIKWSSECTIDIAKNQETLKLARESGCSAIGIGYEISGGSFEKKQGGKFAMSQKYLEYTKIIKKAGIKIKGQFIYGFDSDNVMTLFALWKFCFSLMPMFTALSILTPLPGSGLYREMLSQNRIISLNWRSYSCYMMVMRHPFLNPVLVSFFYPLIHIIFFMTTCTIGLMFLVLFLFFPHYGLVYCFFRQGLF